MACTGNRACAMKSVTFSLMLLLNGTKFFLQMYNIHGLCNRHFVPSVFMLLPGKSESIYRSSMWSAIRSLFERRNLTIEPTTVKHRL